MIRVESDLEFSVTEPVSAGAGAQTVTGTITAAGTHIEVRADGVAALTPPGAAGGVRRAATALAGQGLTLTVAGRDGVLLSLGAVRGRLLERLVLRSPYVRLGRPRALVAALRDRLQFVRAARPLAALTYGLRRRRPTGQSR